jgi:hypothetical protein
MLKQLLAAVSVVGTLGAAAPAFADWYTPAPAPAYEYVTPPAPYYANRYHWRQDGDDWRWRDRDDWRWREHRRHEWREHAWRDHEWREHHRWNRW